jgi:hypothetical protein
MGETMMQLRGRLRANIAESHFVPPSRDETESLLNALDEAERHDERKSSTFQPDGCPVSAPDTAYGVLRTIQAVIETKQDNVEGKVKSVRRLCQDWFKSHPWEAIT